MSRYRLLSITAATVSISITKYIAKRKIVHGTKLTNFQNRFTATDSPVDFILLNFSLFSPFNRVNLWYFSIIFCFYFSDSYSMFEKPCMACFESLHGSDWPRKRKTSGTSHRDSEPFVEKGPIGALQRLKTSHA